MPIRMELVVWGVRLLSAMGVTLILPVLPAMAGAFGLDLAGIGFAVAGFTLAEAAMTPVAGILSDRFGRRIVLIPSLLVFAGGGVLCLFAESWGEVLACRVIQGLGAGPLGVLYTILGSDMATPETLPRIMGRLTVVSSVGTLVYPVAGGLLGAWSWRAPFVLFTLAVPVALLALAVPLKEPQGPMDWGKYLRQTGAILRERRALGLFAVVFLCYCAIYGPINTGFPLFAEAVYGASPAHIGFVFAMVAAGSWLGASILVRLHRHCSFRALMLVAGLCYALPLPVFAHVPVLWLCAVPLFVSGLAQGLSLPIVNDSVALLGTQHDRAAILAVSETCVRVSQSVSPFLFSLACAAWGWGGAFLAGTGAGLLAFLLSWRLFGADQKPEAAQRR